MGEGIHVQRGGTRIDAANTTPDIHVEVERAQPVMDASGTTLIQMAADWIAAQLDVTLDVNGNNPMLADRESAIDALALAIALSDTSSAQDALIARVRKSLADIASGSDVILTNIGKALIDASGSADSLALNVARQDAAAMLDNVLAHVQKHFNDASGDVDRLIANLAKPLHDAGGASDAGTAYIQTYASNYVEHEYVGDKFTF